jgi:hypothetical protein
LGARGVRRARQRPRQQRLARGRGPSLSLPLRLHRPDA